MAKVPYKVNAGQRVSVTIRKEDVEGTLVESKEEGVPVYRAEDDSFLVSFGESMKSSYIRASFLSVLSEAKPTSDGKDDKATKDKKDDDKKDDKADDKKDDKADKKDDDKKDDKPEKKEEKADDKKKDDKDDKKDDGKKKMTPAEVKANFIKNVVNKGKKKDDKDDKKDDKKKDEKSGEKKKESIESDDKSSLEERSGGLSFDIVYVNAMDSVMVNLNDRNADKVADLRKEAHEKLLKIDPTASDDFWIDDIMLSDGAEISGVNWQVVLTGNGSNLDQKAVDMVFDEPEEFSVKASFLSDKGYDIKEEYLDAITITNVRGQNKIEGNFNQRVPEGWLDDYVDNQGWYTGVIKDNYAYFQEGFARMVTDMDEFEDYGDYWIEYDPGM